MYQGFINSPLNYRDPLGTDVEVIVGRPFRAENGVWHAFGHVAVRVFDPDEGKYDYVFDFGRYGEIWGPRGTRGEGILNRQTGDAYLERQAALRDSVGYRIKTDFDTDLRILQGYGLMIKDSERRFDIERQMDLEGQSFETTREYDVGLLWDTPFGLFTGRRFTCVQMTKLACGFSQDKALGLVDAALDVLLPRSAEERLEALFRREGSSIYERRFYRKGNASDPAVTSGPRARALPAEEWLRYQEDRIRAWEKP